MDLKGSLVDTNLRIYPSEQLQAFLEKIPFADDIPANILKLAKHDHKVKTKAELKIAQIELTNKDVENMQRILQVVNEINSDKENKNPNENTQSGNSTLDIDENKDENRDETGDKVVKNKGDGYLTTSDLDWLYLHLQKRRYKGETVPYIHKLLEGVDIEFPENRVLKRNPELEARCVKLRAQQEAREYRKMTKGVDNVRMKFPEDSISYQLKQMNRQLIAIGQFIISIFAGFLFGFRGVEWMVGNLDFGFRLLLGVMCALVIALAEIYFLAKKLNEELNIPETVQLGGPAKFVDDPNNKYKEAMGKEHQD